MRKIIDLQDPISYKNNHIKGSINIPYNELMNNYRKYLNKKDIYYLTCKSGVLSKRMKTILSYLGYNVINLDKK